MLLKDRVAIVTGGARGIGEAVAELFAKEGAYVVVGDLSYKKSDDFKLKSGSNSIFEYHLDITNVEDVRSLFAKTIDKFGKVDILINNAGIAKDITPLEEIKREEWDLMYEVDFMGTVNCIQAALPFMKEQKYGRIVNLASIAGEIGGTATSIAYSTAKASVIVLTKILAKQLGPEGITVNAVAPGYIITEMTKTHVHDLSNVPLRRRGEAEEVASAILFLASDMASYITGTTLDVNGGVYNK